MEKIKIIKKKVEIKMELEKRIFELDGIDFGFEGYFDKSDKGWNGWANPYFTKEVAREIYAKIMEYEDEDYKLELEYSEEKKVFTMVGENGAYLYDSCKAIEIDGVELYRVGSHAFTWS